MERKVLLTDLLKNVEVRTLTGDGDVAVNSVVTDSRKVSPGCLFVAVKGTQVDGHAFLTQAETGGAIGVVVENLPDALSPGLVYVVVPDSAVALGHIAAAFFDHPSEKLKLVGVTGTNGKTSVVTFLFQLFRNLGYRCGMISTVQNQIEEEVIPSTHTTPEAVVLQGLLARMVAAGCSYVFMEVSSHAVVQHRIEGLRFAAGIFTNITHDHLDFHGTFDHYIAAKKGFFDALPAGAYALVNADDRRGSVMVQNTKAEVHTYSIRSMADFRAKILASTFQGLQLLVNDRELWVRLIGAFNVSNLLAVYGIAVLLGEEEENVLTELSALTPPPGRFEVVRDEVADITAIVDYAHTPDALENVLSTISQIRNYNERVITVVGCGGNRDATKRPRMAAIAAKMSDRVIFTSDNSRNEEPEEIIRQMRAGVSAADYRKTSAFVDRKEAIRQAVSEAGKGDIILIAGKGHETYQEVRGQRFHFDDREEVREAFAVSR
ncbi:UDP-N-acetylmuramoyl-L-alanyl-D-glutamate--2,6-diaminopimelate ligase [Ravibacter arvi]|uniref:UDP-N-acetylmuramoyl-L-alanyl-D-glutamate--2, 6-diaminopimelate ligase n=1 Tax=Ravibacter arvi TaxID=2051041 RepID=UPI0031EA4780